MAASLSVNEVVDIEPSGLPWIAKVSSLPVTLTLRGKRMVLKTPTEQHDAVMCEIFSDPLTMQHLPFFHRSGGWTLEEMASRRETLLAAQGEGKSLPFYIHLLGNNGNDGNVDFGTGPDEDDEKDLIVAGTTGFTSINLQGKFKTGIVVPEASARYGQDFCTATADHITLCRPVSKKSTSFQRLKTFLRGVQATVQLDSPFENKQRTPNPLIGLDLAVEKVEEMLRNNKTLGIVGMGGIGKTTLAMTLFNKLGPTFEYHCFVHTVKKIAGSVQDVEKEVWNRLHLHRRGKQLGNYKEGCWSALTGKRLLLVLDDMSSDRDLEVLSNIAGYGVRAAESRFIATSRDGDLLNNMNEIYRVPFLDYMNAKQLFMGHAFPGQTVAPIALEKSVKAIVDKCDGLPLTLELLGKYLHRKSDDRIWAETLDDLDKANAISQRDEKLWAQLRPSYSGLGEKEKEMFLDVTTFFSGTTWTLQEAKEAWRLIYGNEHKRWQILLDMSLVYDVKEDEPIKVHEQLQSLGRKIATESSKSRIWDFTEALNLLHSANESDDQQIHALRLESYEWQQLEHIVSLSGSGVRRLKTVHYLDFKVPVRFGIQEALENKAFRIDRLVLLGCLGHQFCHLFKPDLLTRLVVLKISSPGENGIEYLPSSIGQLSTLKILKIVDAVELQGLPDEFGRLSKLEVLRFLGCPKFHELPRSFGQLSSLKHLEFSDCDLQTLPESFGQLAKLEHLEICDCQSFQSLPKSLGKLQALKHLKFRSCYVMCTLPESFGCLTALEVLDFLDCYKLHSLPDSFGHLSTLKHLKIHWGTSLKSLPDSFTRLSALEFLEFHRCDKLNDLPEYFGQLAKLQHLVIEDCCKMERLPDSLADLKDLRYLVIAYIGLTSIPDFIGTLPLLQTLELGALPYLKGFPPWLGKINLASLAVFQRKTFHVQDGHFALADRKDIAKDIATYDDWRLSSWLDNKSPSWVDYKLIDDREVRTSDYGEALTTLGSSSIDPRMQWDGLTGILYRRAHWVSEDVYGALQDLDTTALEKCAYINRGEDKARMEYFCRRERGYVRYLVKDRDGAEEDGKAASAYQTRILDEIDYDWDENAGSDIDEKLSILSEESLFAGLDLAVIRPVRSYLRFDFSRNAQIVFLGIKFFKHKAEMLEHLPNLNYKFPGELG